MLQYLRQNENLYLISSRGNKKLWYKPNIPNTLPIGEQEMPVATEILTSSTGVFKPLPVSIAGWMSFDRHSGGRISSATAFVSFSPCGKAKPIIEISKRNWSPVEWGKGSRLVYGLDDTYMSHFCAGIMNGLLSTLSHPVADIKVEILSAITDKVNASQRAFEGVGQWLAEALLIEMCKRDCFQNL